MNISEVVFERVSCMISCDNNVFKFFNFTSTLLMKDYWQIALHSFFRSPLSFLCPYIDGRTTKLKACGIGTADTHTLELDMEANYLTQLVAQKYSSLLNCIACFTHIKRMSTVAQFLLNILMYLGSPIPVPKKANLLENSLEF